MLMNFFMKSIVTVIGTLLWVRQYSRIAITTVISLVFVAGLQSCAQQPDVILPEDTVVQDLYIVDCLLPGQLRQLGKTTYITPRRPVRTTAVDCRIRGGEYTAYDRANSKTALLVWLSAAQEGDTEAQNYVGEIFEAGMDAQPNFEMAVLWYRRAADQGHKAAQFNLGTMYERGRGVSQDKVEALNWYRRAWGITDDELAYRSESEQALLAQAQKNAQLQQQLATAQDEVELMAARGQQTAIEYKGAKANFQQAKVELETMREQMAKPEEVSSGGKTFGRYFALMIGNGDYQFLEDLSTPVSDVQRLAGVLKERYGFQVRIITNGDDASVLRAVNQLDEELGEEDNLLIYYSGHSNRRQSGAYNTGYWLPVNAELPPADTFWIPTEQISGHLARIKARRILVVADSEYAGLLADNPAFLLASNPSQLNSEAYVSLRFPNRSRLLMTSGKAYPLPQLPAGSTSVFTDALIDALQKNEDILTAPSLYLRMIAALESRQPELDPQFKTIKRSGDQVGDFFFVVKQ